MEIKLLIWDLDDSFWSGTLAEGDAVVVNEDFARIVRDLNARGVVSSICSKNDHDKARDVLVELGLWDEFVFPHIDFRPKGPTIATMLEQMQLRAENTLFIDDNAINLHEVAAHLPGIHIADARDPATLDLLNGLVVQYEGVRKSRIDKYRALEARQRDWGANEGNREDFLADCQIEMAIADTMDNVDFAERIEELINRTNQMNFTKSRVEPGTLREKFAFNRKYHMSYSIFAWDRYGYHGLIGFALVEDYTRLTHFLFSCRIMHMGIEQRVLQELLRRHPKLDIAQIPVQPEPSPWIKLVRFSDDAVRTKILANEKKAKLTDIRIRIMASCQSAALGHYAGVLDVAEMDVWPRLFGLQKFGTGIAPVLQAHSPESAITEFPAHIVYGAFAELADPHWSAELLDGLLDGLYRQCAEKFAALIRERGLRALIILGPDDEKFTENVRSAGVTVERVRHFNRVWQDIAAADPGLTLMTLGTGPDATMPVLESEVHDSAHFYPVVLKRMGHAIAKWFHAAPVEQEESRLNAAA